MSQLSQITLFDSLQREFCPQLDSSLIAAFLLEIESDASGASLTPTSAQVDCLRKTLLELSAQADESQHELDNFSDLQITSTTDEASSMPEFYYGKTATTSSISDDSSASSRFSFSSPLGFLQAALPHVPTARLNRALEEAEIDVEKEDVELDMWNVVAGILTGEYIRELEERGLDALNEEDLQNMLLNEGSWETVQLRESSKGQQGKSAPQNEARRKALRPLKFAVVDIRQQQHIKKKPFKPGERSLSQLPPPDPWTQLASVSTHLATLLSPHPASFFQSYFHSPRYSSPYDALHAAIASIVKPVVTTSSPMNEDDSRIGQYTTVLFNILDILLPEYESLNVEQRSRLISDIELAVNAAHGRGDDALDLIYLLRDLDEDSENGYWQMGVYHSPTVSQSSFTPKIIVSPRSPVQSIPSGPLPVPPPPLTKHRTKIPSSPASKNKPSPYQWQIVSRQKHSRFSAPSYEDHIPTYDRDVNGVRTKKKDERETWGNGWSSNGNKREGLQEYKSRVADKIRKRDELLREATRMWQKGNKKMRGGEVAFYFAERAREFQELARQEALNVARVMVQSKRHMSGDQDIVDLHGTTVAEAVVIVKETLREYTSLNFKPLKIITGRGAHSANQVSVLKPAVKKALVEDGWMVGTWDGGLIVRGRRS